MAVAYSIAVVYGILVSDQVASLALFNVLAVAAPIWTIMANVGSFTAWLVVATGIFFWGQFSKVGRKIRGRTVGAVLFIGIWLNAAVAFVLKSVIATPRPPFGLNTFEFEQQYFPFLSGNSMPSGHAQLAFMAAVIIGSYYPKARTPLLVFAGLIALSRVGLGAHWVLDVIVGAANGLLLGALWLSMPWDRIQKIIKHI